MLLLEQGDLLRPLLSWPSTIFADTSSGLPSSRAFSSNTLRSASRASSGISSAETNSGGVGAPAMWIATSRANSWKSSLRATKSVSHWTSTSTPTLPVAWM